VEWEVRWERYGYLIFLLGLAIAASWVVLIAGCYYRGSFPLSFQASGKGFAEKGLKMLAKAPRAPAVGVLILFALLD